jgi:outer membrane protein W
MRKIPIFAALFFIISSSFSQYLPELKINKDYKSNISNPFQQTKEYHNNWSINVIFSDNGFGAGATIFKHLSPDASAFAGIFFSGAKDEREFEVVDIFGNTYIPYKVNRMFLIPLNIGMQFRLFRDDVTDDLRPFLNFGASPTAVIYTPYNESFFASFGKARAKYTVGLFGGVGLDYLTSKTSSLSLNVRYYYTQLFGEGIESLESKEKRFFGGLYFVFSYNFMK